MSASPITCHVLDTLSGAPASSLRVVLTLLTTTDAANGAVSYCFSGMTDEDGRVKKWQPSVSGLSLQDAVKELPDGKKTLWNLKFESNAWYEAKGVECFWSDIDVKFFFVARSRHYHVPLLMGPWTYTTYRGS